MYHLFQNSFREVIKTLKVYKVGEYTWRTLYDNINSVWNDRCVMFLNFELKFGTLFEDPLKLGMLSSAFIFT